MSNALAVENNNGEEDQFSCRFGWGISEMIESEFAETSFCNIVRLVETLKTREGRFSIRATVEELQEKNRICPSWRTQSGQTCCGAICRSCGDLLEIPTGRCEVQIQRKLVSKFEDDRLAESGEREVRKFWTLVSPLMEVWWIRQAIGHLRIQI